MSNLYKQSAKAVLKGYWLRSITAVMLILAVSTIPSLLMQIVLTLTQIDYESTLGTAMLLVATVVGALLASPVALGFNRILWLRTIGEDASLSEILYLFGNPRLLFKYLAIYITKTLLIVLPAVVVAAPAVVIVYLTDMSSASAEPTTLTALLSLGAVALAVIAGILAVLQGARYSMLDFVFVKHCDCSIRFILRACSDMCSGRTGIVISLYASFIGWFLLNATGFGQLYTTPYFNAALACAARQFTAEDDYNRKQMAEAEGEPA